MNASLGNLHNRSDFGSARSPFLLENESEYQAWRRCKLELREHSRAVFVIKLDAQGRLDATALDALHSQLSAYGFAAIESNQELGKSEFLALNRQLGLIRLDDNPGAGTDRVTALHVVSRSDPRARYIPYSNRALNWHTDGYYNSHCRQIYAFALYCVRQADRGGENYLFDHELMYILIRDRSADMMAALMSTDLMQIPANRQAATLVRAEQSGPVFSIDPNTDELHMRYSSRARHIVWNVDQHGRRALELVREILRDSDARIDLQLRSRQGIVCSNILHGRHSFSDRAGTPGRLVYRARYYDSIVRSLPSKHTMGSKDDVLAR